MSILFCYCFFFLFFFKHLIFTNAKLNFLSNVCRLKINAPDGGQQLTKNNDAVCHVWHLTLLLMRIHRCSPTPSPQHPHPSIFLWPPPLSTPSPPDSRYVVALSGLVCSPLPAGVGLGPGRLRSMSVLPGTWAAGFPQVEQQNSPASPAGGQRELQLRRQQCPDLTKKEGPRPAGPTAPVGQEPTP